MRPRFPAFGERTHPRPACWYVGVIGTRQSRDGFRCRTRNLIPWMTMKRKLRWPLLLALLLQLAIPPAHAGKAGKPGDVYRQWTGRLSELGILPVYPPREDVVVGDVYLLPMHPLDNSLAGAVGGLGISGIRIGFLPWLDHSDSRRLTNVRDFYQFRPDFPDTPPQSNLMAVPALPPGPNPRVGDLFDPAPYGMRRLKQVAFPEFTVTTISDVNAAAMVPIEAILLNIGFDYSKVSRISLKIPKAESYGVATTPLLDELFVSGIGRNRKGGLYLPAHTGKQTNLATLLSPAAGPMARAMFDESLYTAIHSPERDLRRSEVRRLEKRIGETKPYLYVTLITEVFYAREIDISITYSKSKALGVEAKPVSPEEVKKWMDLGDKTQSASKPAPPAPAAGDAAPAAPAQPAAAEAPVAAAAAGVDAPGRIPSGSESVRDPFEVAAKLKNMKLGRDSVGGDLRVVSVSDSAIGLKRTFERPIAVGVRGVVVKIKSSPEELDPIRTEDGREFSVGYEVITTYP